MRIRERSVEVDGLRLHVREVGSGDPLLLINGIGAHTAMWTPLEEVLDEFHLIEFDAPGTGQSATSSYPVSIPALAVAGAAGARGVRGLQAPTCWDTRSGAS